MGNPHRGYKVMKCTDGQAMPGSGQPVLEEVAGAGNFSLQTRLNHTCYFTTWTQTGSLNEPKEHAGHTQVLQVCLPAKEPTEDNEEKVLPKASFKKNKKARLLDQDNICQISGTKLTGGCQVDFSRSF